MGAGTTRSAGSSQAGKILFVPGSWFCPAWLAEWSRKHPSGAGRAVVMTMYPGTGLLSQMVERGRWRLMPR